MEAKKARGLVQALIDQRNVGTPSVINENKEDNSSQIIPLAAPIINRKKPLDLLRRPEKIVGTIALVPTSELPQVKRTFASNAGVLEHAELIVLDGVIEGNKGQIIKFVKKEGSQENEQSDGEIALENSIEVVDSKPIMSWENDNGIYFVEEVRIVKSGSGENNKSQNQLEPPKDKTLSASPTSLIKKMFHPDLSLSAPRLTSKIIVSAVVDKMPQFAEGVEPISFVRPENDNLLQFPTSYQLDKKKAA